MKFIISDTMVRYILYQRTGYLKGNLGFTLLSYLGYVKPLYKLSIELKYHLFKQGIKREFSDDIREDYKMLSPHLPLNASSILDIGCGVAGIDILLYNHYKRAKIYLLDKSIIDDTIHYGYEHCGSYYNSLTVAKQFLEDNGAHKSDIHLQEATRHNDITFRGKFDIIISLLSCGFHYPLNTYIDQMYDKLNPGGVLIIDIRKDTNAEVQLLEMFGDYYVIKETVKYLRVKVVKKIDTTVESH